MPNTNERMSFLRYWVKLNNSMLMSPWIGTSSDTTIWKILSSSWRKRKIWCGLAEIKSDTWMLTNLQVWCLQCLTHWHLLASRKLNKTIDSDKSSHLYITTNDGFGSSFLGFASLSITITPPHLNSRKTSKVMITTSLMMNTSTLNSHWWWQLKPGKRKDRCFPRKIL